MRADVIPLAGTAPGTSQHLTVLHFGDEAAAPVAYIQAGLHADEAPGMICAHHLRGLLEELEANGQIIGHIVLVPAANPIGLAQTLLGTHHGRFALGDGVNFNRAFPELAEGAAARLAESLGQDPVANREAVILALRATLAEHRTARPAEHLKALLLGLALGADTVLDLHCDGEATVHLYTLTSQADAFMPLAAWLGADAVLTSELSGGHPFDEAVTRSWADLARRFEGLPLPPLPIATTVELRGGSDVSHELAAGDARALVSFLAHRGHLAIEPGVPPAARCQPTPLEGSESLEAPAAGLIVYHRATGEQIAAGDRVADIVDPATGRIWPVTARTSGVLFARSPLRFAETGRKIGKIAGTIPFRSGLLLSP
jgi:uncharacterized protein